MRRLFDYEDERQRFVAKLDADLKEGLDELDRARVLAVTKPIESYTETIDRRRRRKSILD
ncbi:MAG: hypothetical protein WDM85_05555 [Caulobacteraceae bacterium]